MDAKNHDKVVQAYSAVWKRTRDLNAAYAAAEQTYRILHPETKDAAVVKCIVAIAIGGAIGEEEAPRAARSRSEAPPRKDSTAA